LTSVSSPLIEIQISLKALDINREITLLIKACKGDKRDRFGHINYWKCMLELIPYILGKDIRGEDINIIAKEIKFSRDQVRRSLERFVKKGVLIKEYDKFGYIYRLNRRNFPIISLLRSKNLMLLTKSM